MEATVCVSERETPPATLADTIPLEWLLQANQQNISLLKLAQKGTR